MYKILKDKLKLPRFDAENWTSHRRGNVPGFVAYEGPSLADLTYEDKDGVLTEHLYGNERRVAWSGKWPTYHIEVKSTAGALNMPFRMSQEQLQTVSLCIRPAYTF